MRSIISGLPQHVAFYVWAAKQLNNSLEELKIGNCLSCLWLDKRIIDALSSPFISSFWSWVKVVVTALPVLLPGERNYSVWQSWSSTVHVNRVKLSKHAPADGHRRTHNLLSMKAGIVELYLWQPEIVSALCISQVEQGVWMYMYINLIEWNRDRRCKFLEVCSFFGKGKQLSHWAKININNSVFLRENLNKTLSQISAFLCCWKGWCDE